LKMRRTVSACSGSISRVFLVLWPRWPASTRPIADRGSRAVPKFLACVLVHRPEVVFRVLFRLILVEERHDLADHVAHRIVAELLGDRDEPHSVLRQLADIKFELELARTPDEWPKRAPAYPISPWLPPPPGSELAHGKPRRHGGQTAGAPASAQGRMPAESGARSASLEGATTLRLASPGPHDSSPPRDGPRLPKKPDEVKKNVPT